MQAASATAWNAYVGLDIHWRQSTICVLDGRGRKTRSRTIKGPWSTVLDELKTIRAPFAIRFEASTGYGYLFERLQRHCQLSRGAVRISRAGSALGGRSAGTRHHLPLGECSCSEQTMMRGSEQMATDSEEVLDRAVDGREVLQMGG